MDPSRLCAEDERGFLLKPCLPDSMRIQCEHTTTLLNLFIVMSQRRRKRKIKYRIVPNLQREKRNVLRYEMIR